MNWNKFNTSGYRITVRPLHWYKSDLKIYFNFYRFLVTVLLILTPLLLIFTLSTYAIDLPNRPDNGIYDPSHYLNETVAKNLADANKNNDTQIGVYIVDNIDSSIEETSREVARHWKIGDAKNNRGILITIAVKDKKLRIETSNEVSGDLTDIEAKQIITNVKPELRSQDYSMAVNKMIEQIKEKTANQSNDNNYEVPGIIPMIGLIILMIMVIISILDEIPLERDTYTATRRLDDRNDDANKKDYTDSDLATGLLLGSLLASQNHNHSNSRNNDDEDDDSYSSHSSSYHEDDDDDNHHSSSSSSYHDDDDDWFSGSGSDWSSSDWSGGGFDGGGASGDW